MRRTNDLPFWLAVSDPSIRGFGVPGNPWGFNSGMDFEDVGRDQCDAMGLTKPNDQIVPVEKDLKDAL